MNAYLESEAEEVNSPDFAREASESWRLSPAAVAILQTAVRKGVEPQATKAEVERLVATGCNPARMKQVLAQLQSPLMMRVTAIEKDSNSPQGREATQQYLLAHSQDVPSLPRMAAIEKLDKGVGLTDYSIKLALAVRSGIADGMGVPGAKNMKSTYVGDYARSLVGGVQLVVSSYVYRSLTDAELREYAQMMTSEPMKSFFATSMQALLAVMEKRARIVGQEIKASVPPGSLSVSAFSVGAAAAQQQSKHPSGGTSPHN